MRDRWWVEDAWEQDGEYRVLLIYRSGWDYWVYIARVDGDRYCVLERVSDTAQTSDGILRQYDLCDVVDNAKVSFSADFFPPIETR